MNTSTLPAPSGRLVSLDAYRGFIMVLMASAALGIPELAKNTGWDGVAVYLDHARWEGGVLWDMIQPAFMFMVGVAVPFSLAKRRERGASLTRILLHALYRAVVLVALGVLLASNDRESVITNYVFTNVLAQIGLGYFFLVLLFPVGWKWQAVTVAVLLIGYWAWFALWPLPAPEFDWSRYSMTAADALPGFRGHWTMNTNAAADFDRWFLNLFPRTSPFVFNKGGYETLNFIPSLATMMLGMITGEGLKSGTNRWRNLGLLVLAGLVFLGLGWLSGGICPIIKRIWTPSWVLWSTGWVLLMLAFFYLLTDAIRCRLWALPFTVVGMNSIAVYLMFQITSSWFRETMARHGFRSVFDGPYGPMWKRTSVLIILWIIAVWLYRRKTFFKI